MSKTRRILVTGAGGFIGHHLVSVLKSRGAWVRGVDLHPPQWVESAADELAILDLRDPRQAREATAGVDSVYALAADMGGMGYIAQHHSTILHNNLLIDTNTIEAARLAGVESYFYSSSACVYPEHLQNVESIAGLKEEEAHPAQPADAYGWEKLLGEKLCLYYREFGMRTHVARFHNIFGPLGTWDGGREKAPAALCRKIATAKLTGNPVVEIWGDGKQTRSFCYIDDCVEGIIRLTDSNWLDPINIGQDRMISINGLADLIAEIAGFSIVKRHVDGFEGVRGRNSDNTLAADILGFSPAISLEEGLARTYAWIEKQVAAQVQLSGAIREVEPEPAR